MPRRLTIRSLTRDRSGGFCLTLGDGSSMCWPDERLLHEYVDRQGAKSIDDLPRRLLARIRAADPTFANLRTIRNVIYERPDVREIA